jgi:hypothetical protein
MHRTTLAAKRSQAMGVYVRKAAFRRVLAVGVTALLTVSLQVVNAFSRTTASKPAPRPCRPPSSAGNWVYWETGPGRPASAS